MYLEKNLTLNNVTMQIIIDLLIITVRWCRKYIINNYHYNFEFKVKITIDKMN